MATIQNAIDALKTSAALPKTSKTLKERVAHVSSSLILMKSSILSNASKKTLHDLLRSPLIPLYIAFPEQALGLSLSLFKAISNDKILPSSDADEKTYWEKVQHSILSGIMDYIEERDNVESKNAVASIFYPTICSMFFPISDSTSSSVREIGVNLRASAYMTLYESAYMHADNQRKLRDPELLGGKRIGLVLSQTDDYLAVETLFTLIARILPSSSNSSNSPKARSKFIREIFLLPAFSGGNKMVEVLDDISKTNWDETAAVLIDILAAENINFPQPFTLDEIRTCGTTFPQPTSADRLYLDHTCFFSNITDEGEAYESLQVFYADVDSIRLKPGPTTTGVSVKLRAPAILAESPMTHSGSPSADFEIRNEDTKRFLDTLAERGLQKAISGRQRKLPRSSVPSLSITMTESEHRMSRQEQVEGLTRTYDLDDNVVVFPRAGKPEPQIDPKLSNGLPGWNTLSEPVSSAIPKKAAGVPIQATLSAVFGNAGDDLSDIEDIEFTTTEPNPAAAPNYSDQIDPVKANRKADTVETDDETDYLPPKRNTRTRAPPLKKIAFESQMEDDNHEPRRSLRRRQSSTALADELQKVADNASNLSSIARDAISAKKNVNQSGLENTSVPPSEISAETPARSALSRERSPHSNQANLTLSENSVIVLEDDPAQHPRGRVRSRSPAGPAFSTKHGRSDKVARAESQVVLGGPADQPPSNALRGRAARMKGQRNQVSKIKPEPSKEKRKRKATAAMEPDTNGQPSPSKRQRTARAADEPPKPASSETMAHPKTAEAKKSIKSAQRYGKKGKASSPPQNPTTGVNFDELPGSTDPTISPPPKRGKSATKDVTFIDESRKTRASAMQRKNKKIDTPTTIIDKPEKKALKARPKRGLTTNKPQEKQAVSAIDNPKKALPLKETKAKRHQISDIETVNLQDKEEAVAPGKNASELAHEEVVDGSIPRTGGQDAMDLSGDYALHRVDDDFIDYVVPVKNDSSLLKSPVAVMTPQKDAPMIDLTQGSPVNKTKITTTAEAISQPKKSAIVVFSPPSDSFQRFPSPDTRSRHSIAFAPSAVHSSTSPLDDEQNPFAIPHPSNEPKHGRRVLEDANADPEYFRAPPKQPKATHRDSELQDIMEILQEIQTAIVQNISKKVEGVKREVRIGRDHIFRQAAFDMAGMRSESVCYFNTLVELEKDYASYRRKNIQSWEDVRRTNRNVCGIIDQAIEDHDRSVSSKRLPKSLFAKPLPASLTSQSVQPKRKK